MTRFALGSIALVFAAIWAGGARADGLPVLGVEVGPSGVTTPTAEGPRYVALRAGPDTLVARIDRGSGEVPGSRLVAGRYTIPAVAYDGSAAGLSADESTLVIIRPRLGFPRKETELVVLAGRSLRIRERLTLAGDFSFDALSPDGRLLYLVEYVSPRDPTKYLVRLYDLDTNRLVREPIIDPREVGDVMRGTPLTRASSPDGRWAYTLYDGGEGGHPFIHALDTVARTARCIDLHGVQGSPIDTASLVVSPDGGTLTLVNPDYAKPFAVVDTQTFEVTGPTATSPTAADEDDSGSRIALVGGIVLALLLLLGGRRLLRRRQEPLDVRGGVAP
ncbi:MAG: hypothetical protein ACRDMY_09685 [Gaiellaceae bacterium]